MQKIQCHAKIELPGKFSCFYIPHKLYLSDNQNTLQKRPKKVKRPKKALKRDLKTKSTKINYIYPNIRVSELTFIFLDTLKHIIYRTIKTAFLTYFNLLFWHFSEKKCNEIVTIEFLGKF